MFLSGIWVDIHKSKSKTRTHDFIHFETRSATAVELRRLRQIVGYQSNLNLLRHYQHLNNELNSCIHSSDAADFWGFMN